MTIGINIRDSLTDNAVRVINNSMASYHVTPPLPHVGTTNTYRYFKQEFSSNGDGTGVTNMNTNGSVTPLIYSIKSSADCDIHVMMLVIVIADTAVAHNNYGNISPLINGVDIFVIESGNETHVVDAVKTGGQFLAQSGLLNPFGDGATVNELSNWSGTTDAQIIQIPLSNFVPGGIRLGRGVQDEIEFIVRDDLTGLTEHVCYGIGYCHYPV